MPERVKDDHQWVGGAMVDIPKNVVRSAYKRGTLTVRKDTQVAIMDVYCKRCQKRWDRANGKPCEAIASREHLTGGPLGDQRRRRAAG